MGWFWAETQPLGALAPPSNRPSITSKGQQPPPSCPMHKKTNDALNGSSQPPKEPSRSGCPVPHGSSSSSPPPPPPPRAESQPQPSQSSSSSILSQLNPLNYMFPDLSQKRAPNQTYILPTSREESTIPMGSGDGNWQYPSPQQMYNAMLRKGGTDVDITAVESMVSVHNYLNEGAWEEIRGWEARFSQGLWKGLQVCKRGEDHTAEELERNWDGTAVEPTLVRFQGRPNEMTPKASILQMLGKVYPSKYGLEPPFDRHDWYISREHKGEKRQVRYVIDYYSGEPDPNGDPVFYLDVRPAATPLGTAERFVRWGTDTWWKAIGGDERETNPKPFFRYSSAKA